VTHEVAPGCIEWGLVSREVTRDALDHAQILPGEKTPPLSRGIGLNRRLRVGVAHGQSVFKQFRIRELVLPEQVVMCRHKKTIACLARA
jgi:hypothetical protein